MNFTQKQAITAVAGVLFAILAISPAQQALPTHDFGPPQGEYSFDLNSDLRIRNFTNSWGSGSCVHVSFAMLLRWQGEYELADWWISTYSGGETHARMVEKLQRHNIPYATTYRENDVEFLETACRSRRGCMVTTTYSRPGDHMIILVHLDRQYAYTLDNNSISTVHRWDRAEFLELWRNSGSWATTPLYNPPPPKPFS